MFTQFVQYSLMDKKNEHSLTTREENFISTCHTNLHWWWVLGASVWSWNKTSEHGLMNEITIEAHVYVYYMYRWRKHHWSRFQEWGHNLRKAVGFFCTTIPHSFCRDSEVHPGKWQHSQSHAIYFIFLVTSRIFLLTPLAPDLNAQCDVQEPRI